MLFLLSTPVKRWGNFMPKYWTFNAGRGAKITQEIADDIRKLKKSGLTYREINEKYPQISAQQMSRIVTNQAWTKPIKELYK
jgi:hypothetical protein